MNVKKRKVGRVVRSILLAVVIAAAVIMGIWHKTTAAVFHNLTQPHVRVPDTDTWTGGESYLKIPYSSVSDSDYVDLYVPSDVKNPPLLILVHGGGFVTNDSQSKQAVLMYRYFRDHGYACASVNYRLAEEAPFPGAIEDVKACIRFLQANAGTYGYDSGRMAIFGESAGGYLAIAAAMTNDEEFNSLPYIGESSGESDGCSDDGSSDKQEEEQSSAAGEDSVPAEGVNPAIRVLIDYYGDVDFTSLDAQWKEIGYSSVVRSIANGWIQKNLPEGYTDIHSYWLRKDISKLSKDELAPMLLNNYIDENLRPDSDLSVYISHGDADLTVPVTQSQNLYSKVSGIIGTGRTKLNIVKNAGHAGDGMYSDRELEKMDRFIQAHM